jgi:hypothetical protein
MNKFGVSLGTALGIVAIVVYLAFLAHQFLTAGQAGRALGIGVFLSILKRPAFWVIAALACAVALPIALH